MNKDTVTVEVSTRFGNFRLSMPIDGVVVEQFAPIDFCDDHFMAVFAHGVEAHSLEAKKILAMRQDVSKDLAETLSKLLLQIMESSDTFDGYKRGEY